MMIQYRLSKDAYEEYISCTKNNEHTSFGLAEKKLNRNIMLSKLIRDDVYSMTYQYGTLCIQVVFGEITSVYKVKKWNGIRRRGRSLELVNT